MKRYTFTIEETQEIKAAREKNRDKNVEKRLAALEMRAEGKRNKEISEKTGFHTQYITVLVSRYKANGLASITESHYHGNHRNLSYEEEEALLEPFRLDSKAGKMVSVHDIEAAYREVVGHSIREPLNKSAAALSGPFAPTYRFENLEIRKGFLRFPNLNLETKSLADRSCDLIRASLGKVKKRRAPFGTLNLCTRCAAGQADDLRKSFI